MTFARGKEAQARKAAKAKRSAPLVAKALGVSSADKGPIRDRQHMGRLSSLSCLVCGLGHPQIHHIRECFQRTMGVRVGDDKTVPLCATHHAELHLTNNATFWERYKIDPVERAEQFYAETLRGRTVLREETT